MKFEHLKLSNPVLHKRTFEGERDSLANDNPITSKYYRSQKWAVTYDIEGYEHNPAYVTTTTKAKGQMIVDSILNAEKN